MARSTVAVTGRFETSGPPVRTIITRLRRRPSPGTALAATAAILVGSGVAYAAIPSADGTIKGCYATTNGLLLGIPRSKGDTRIVEARRGVPLTPVRRVRATGSKGPCGHTNCVPDNPPPVKLVLRDTQRQLLL